MKKKFVETLKFVALDGVAWFNSAQVQFFNANITSLKSKHSFLFRWHIDLRGECSPARGEGPRRGDDTRTTPSAHSPKRRHRDQASKIVALARATNRNGIFLGRKQPWFRNKIRKRLDFGLINTWLITKVALKKKFIKHLAI